MNLPDGPKLPALLQTLSLIADPTGFLETCCHRYGDPFTLRVLGVNSPPVIFFSHPDAVQAIFTTLSNRFELGKVTHVFRPLTGDRSLIMQDGARHQKQRQLLMPALHGEGLYRCGSLMGDISRTTQPHGSLVSVQDWMLEISLEIILRVVFGLRPGPRYQALKVRLQRLLERINSPLYSLQFFLPLLQQNWGPWSPWGQFLHLRQQIDDLLYAEIDQRRDQVNLGTDILSLLITARDEVGASMDDTELRDQLVTLLLLGHETTASGLTWAFYWLYRHPDVLARLQHELDALGPDPDPLTLAQQPYLTAVCKEALRVYPIALIAQPRRVREPIELAGYQFEPGAVLVPCVYLAHRRPETYPEPLQFRPERFLSSKSAYEYFPFGGGNRSCIGMALALFEMKLVLATLLRTYEFEPVAGFQPLRRPARRGITFVPPGPVQLRILGLRTAANDGAVLAHPST